MAATPENLPELVAKQQRGELLEHIADRNSKDQGRRGPAAVLVPMGSDLGIPQSPRRAIIEKSSR